MAQVLTLVTVLFAIALLWYLRRRSRPADRITVSIRLDRSIPGAQLHWNIANTGPSAATLTHFAMAPRHVGEGRGERAADIPLPEPITLKAGEHAHSSMDVDWRLLSARSIAICDAGKDAHLAPASQLDSVQRQLREIIDRRAGAASARDWLFGATNLAFGVVLLGLGFFMLMWIIATG